MSGKNRIGRQGATPKDHRIAPKVIAEAGLIGDPRCEEALDLLESKRLADGGWRAEGKHYRVVDEPANGGSLADWGLVSRKQVMNPFVTLDALHVLQAAGRLRMDNANITRMTDRKTSSSSRRGGPSE